MYREVVLLLCVNNLNALVATYKETAVTYLTTALGVEWSVLEYNLVQCLVLLLCLTVAEDCCLVLSVVIAYECALALVHGCPVAVLYCSSVACACLLLEHLLVELCHVYCKAVLAKDELCKVDWETVCIVECEGLNAVDLVAACALCVGDDLVKHLHASRECAEE